MNFSSQMRRNTMVTLKLKKDKKKKSKMGNNAKVLGTDCILESISVNLTLKSLSNDRYQT